MGTNAASQTRDKNFCERRSSAVSQRAENRRNARARYDHVESVMRDAKISQETNARMHLAERHRDLETARAQRAAEGK